MNSDVLDLYARASAWTVDRVEGAVAQPGAATPCDQWDVRTLLNHMLETQHYFLGAAQGKDVPPPGPTPLDVLSADPVADFAQVRDQMIEAYCQPDVMEKAGPSLGIAFADQLLHGWDLAMATGQDSAMPDDLAEAAYATIHGRFTDEQRKGVFKPEITVGPDATAQDRLLAYTGRNPLR